MKTLILGGRRSGKSTFALRQAQSFSHVAVLVTAVAFDEEMEDRIRRHQNERPSHWLVREAPHDLPEALLEANEALQAVPNSVILVDCITLWLANRLMQEVCLDTELFSFLEALKQVTVPVLIVGNEVGQGIIPENLLARRFSDENGWMNQKVAALCDHLIVCYAGHPLVLK